MKERLARAKQFALEAGAYTLQYFNPAGGVKVEIKADDSPVTQADRGAEQLIRDLIAEEFPEDAILGEEHEEKAGTSGVRWILDPVDGTQSFVCGVPLYGTMIGLEYEGEVLAGVVYMPAMREIYFGAHGLGAQWAQNVGPEDRNTLAWELKPAQVSSVTQLSEAVVSTTSANYYEQTATLDLFEKVRISSRVLRGWSDCYAFLLLATGRVDLTIEPMMNPWDHAALMPIITEAGGVYTDFKGRRSIHHPTAIAANPELHADALKKLFG